MKRIMIFIILIISLVACGQSNDTNNGSSEGEIKPIEVELDAPETVDANESVVFTATVTQDGKAVDDASEVDFEIWKDGLKDDSEMIEATNEGEGVYSIEKTFSEDGIYHVQSHVTARDMHTMPKAQITVGDVQASETEETDDDESSHDHSHSHVNIQMQQPDEITTGEAKLFTVEIQNEEQTLENASVTYEVWHEEKEKHDWIDVTESEPGIYEAEITFDESREYTINVHVEKEEIHDHKEFTVDVK